MKDTEFYAELDEDTGLFCVFGSDSGHAYESYASLSEAEVRAKARNERAESELNARSARVHALAGMYFR